MDLESRETLHGYRNLTDRPKSQLRHTISVLDTRQSRPQIGGAGMDITDHGDPDKERVHRVQHLKNAEENVQQLCFLKSFKSRR